MGRIASATGLLAMWGVVPLVPAAPATAQTLEDGSEIIVTARRRDEAQQRVPVSLSIVDGKAIEALDIRNTTDLSARTPNLLAPANAVAISAPTLFIRGIGEGDRNWND